MRSLFIRSTIFLFGILTLLFTACERRMLEDEFSNTALIPVGAIWDDAGITPQNVTVLFYNQNDGKLFLEHRFEHNSKRIQSYVSLPVGIYTVVLFNELRDQIDYVGIRGHENFATLEAYSKPNIQVRTRATNDNYVHEPEIFASAKVIDFEVTTAMVLYTQDQNIISNATTLSSMEALVDLVPESKVSKLTIIAKVKGLHNARMPALVDLRNMSGAYFVAADKNSMEPVTYQFTMNNRTYDAGSMKNGTISTTISTFGVLGSRSGIADQRLKAPVLLDFLFMLTDAEGTIINMYIDVTDKIRFATEKNGDITLYIDIELPDALPDVIPEGSEAGSGFETNLTDWDNVEIPLTVK